MYLNVEVYLFMTSQYS